MGGSIMQHTLLPIACAAALLTISPSGVVRAGDYDRLTYFTFSAPVRIPGVILPAGTYAFELVNPGTSRSVLHVTSRNGRKNYGQFFFLRDFYRNDATSTPALVFLETPVGTAPAVRGWFFPTERHGYEFVYSKGEMRGFTNGSPGTAHSD
jgi:hypothetical protein